MALLIFTTLIVCLAMTVWLIQRQHLFHLQNRLGINCPCQYKAYRSCLRLLTKKITSDESFWEIGKTNLLQQHLEYRDPNDPYAQVDQLIEWIAGQPSPESAISLKPILKAFYQIQYTFHWNPSCISDLVEPAVQAIRRIEEDRNENPSSFLFVQTNQQIDLKTMQPVNEGTMVKQPFGVIMMKGEKVISKARVLCQ